MACEWIGWCELGPNAQAAWVQAVGSVFAIGLASYVPWRIASGERSRIALEHAYKERSLAFVLRHSVGAMHKNVGVAQSRWSLVATRYTEDEVAEFLRVPAEITERLIDLHVMGDAGVGIQRAIVAVDAARTAVYTQYAFWRHDGVWHDPQTGEEHPLEDPEDVEQAFLEAARATKAAVDAIERLLL